MTEENFADGLAKRLERHSDALNEMSEAFIEFSLAHVELKRYIDEYRQANPSLFSMEDIDA